MSQLKLGVLTSSRADFGIYLPLLRAFKMNQYFDIEIIAFGSHLSSLHGSSIDHIYQEDFSKIVRVESIIEGDSQVAISTSMALTALKFASFWESKKGSYDYVFCLGDRFEMFAAVMASIPFNIRLIHLHGGEMTLGAIDNIFRHSVSHASFMHFVSTNAYENRLRKMLDVTDNIYNVGALSLDNLAEIELLDTETFKEIWNIDMGLPTILVTLHPETNSDLSKNKEYAIVITDIINKLLQFQFVITMPNADSYGNTIRSIFRENLKGVNFKIVENFGTLGYFSCMSLSRMVLGNSSSGIIEAASLNRYNINLGSRQEGRLKSLNTIDLKFDMNLIESKIVEINQNPNYVGENLYWNGGAVSKIINILKSIP
jgi:GDP/UDP-N,N'-diacetylbacillosamine 2-epimerase (hydrolysing)